MRVCRADTFFEIFARVAAVRAIVSRPIGFESHELELLEQLTHSWAGKIEFIEETDDDLDAAIRGGQVERVRATGSKRVPELVRRAAAEHHVFIADAPVLSGGRIELFRYVQEQSLSFDYHRYGNLGTRASEKRTPLTPAN